MKGFAASPDTGQPVNEASSGELNRVTSTETRPRVAAFWRK